MPSSSCSTREAILPWVAAALVVVALPAFGCTRATESAPTKKTPVPASDEITARSRDLMSTYVTISVAAPESARALAAIEAAFDEMARLEDVLSEWREDSEISRVNAQAGVGPVVVSAELFEVVELGYEVSQASLGAFDLTFAALQGTWDFRSLRPEVPQAEALAEKAALVDYQQLTLDKHKRSIALGRAGMRMGLGGIAKGTIVDSASKVLTQLGFNNHLVVAGGDLYASGRKASKPWNIGVRAPNGQGLWATLEVENLGVATSGNYERFFIKDGVRYHHILDPKTGQPARGLSSVTIVANNAGLADAFATAVFVLGKDKGLALANQRQDLEALIFDDQEFIPSHTAGLAGRLQILPKAPTAPTDENDDPELPESED